jgi:hypothetical protein
MCAYDEWAYFIKMHASYERFLDPIKEVFSLKFAMP